MKKVLLVAVMALGSLTAIAQEEEIKVVAEEATEAVAEEATEAVTEEVATEAVAEEAATEAVEETATEEATEAVVEEAVVEEAAEEATEEVVNEAPVEEVVETAVEEQDGFNELALEEVPEAITAALEAAHPGATISKAYVNESAQYKLEVAKEDGETAELYADAEGNWIEM